MHRLAIVTCGIVLAFVYLSDGQSAGVQAQIRATARQRVHPVLIRNDHNSLLQLTLEVKPKDVRVKTITISLENANHIEQLQLFYCGNMFNAKTDKPFGEIKRPAENIVFIGEQALNPGTNVFWLSCRLKDNADLSHKVDATCPSIGTSIGNVSPKDSTPNIRKRIGIALRKHNDDGVHTYRIPALATTPKGTLLCVYDMRRRSSRDLQEDIDIGLSRSTDGGRTWQPIRVIMDMGETKGLPQEQNGCSDPGIIVDPKTGEIFVAAVWMVGRPGRHQWDKGGSEPGYEIGKTAQFLMVRSKDDGLTWTKPENMTRTFKREDWILFAPSPQQGIALNDGTLVWPVQGRDAKDQHFSTIMVSRDHGANWTVGSASAVGNTECQAVALDDGSIMLNCRSERPTKFRSVYVTRDLGKTWQPHASHRKALIEPNCNGSTYRFRYVEDGRPKHVLLFANPHSQQGRTHHTVQLSLDNGKTWPAKCKLLLDEGRGRGYPSISRIDQRHFGIVYEGSQADLVFETIALDELLRK